MVHRMLKHKRGQADHALQKPEMTSTPSVKPRDLVDEISNFTSAVAADPTSFFQSCEELVMSFYSIEYEDLTSSAASASSSLGLKLSTADGAASTSIHSELSQVSANVSSASAALQAAQSAINATSTTSSATSSTSTGVGCVQTAAVGMGAVVGGIAVLAQM